MASARTHKAGRPRKSGERWPSGGLKPPPPNPVVIAQRRARVGAGGDLTRATTDLDVALARGWLTEDEHRAARDYARLYRAAGVALPRLRARDVGEAPGENAHSPAAADPVAPPSPRDGDPEAQTRLRGLWATLRDGERRALAHACLVEGDLDFVQLRCRGVMASTRFELDLKSALERVRQGLDPRLKRSSALPGQSSPGAGDRSRAST